MLWESLLSAENNPRIARESKTIGNMVFMYCRKKHGVKNALCGECGELLKYALSRLEKCPFQEGKSTCAKCPVHCYKPGMKNRILEVMRFSGPRIIFHHPVMALRHMVDGFRREPVKHG
jgi:hypothetical protein